MLRQDIQKYRSLFPQVSAAIQSKKYRLKGDTIQYIYRLKTSRDEDDKGQEPKEPDYDEDEDQLEEEQEE
jgi:hypothetical protein